MPLPDQDAAQSSTPATLSKLFTSPESLSRGVSYTSPPGTTANGRTFTESGSLSSHLLNRGLLDSRHSDITVHAFGNSYKLHKLLLDRAPFFRSAFSGPWAESSAKEMSLHPEEVDSNITRNAFELALKRIYGSSLPVEEDQEAVGLFATGCWLDMSDLVESSLEGILRQMHPSKLGEIINLVTKNYYGKPGDRILASAKAVLCREGWEMPYEYWDDVPADIIREVVGGDPFYVPGEWERWYLAVRLLNRRLKAKATEAGLISTTGQYLQSKPSSLKFFAVRFDTVYRRESIIGGRPISDRDEAWVSLYTLPEISPLLVLLDEGIHYVHLRFEQLQQIRNQKDLFGIPIVPEKVISSALWMSMELRQRIVNAQEADFELSLTQEAEDFSQEEASNVKSEPTKGKKQANDTAQQTSEEMESGSWDGNAKPRKFWIPGSDSSSVMGGTSEAYMASTSAAVANWTPHMSRLSNSFEPADVQWATDLTGFGIEAGKGHSREASEQTIPHYSHFPPFRFSAEFPNPRTLKEKKRVYSQTVWYAGSMWNLYIQRINTSKAQQLGIYLHRAKERDPIDDPLAQLTNSPVQDQIRQVERVMRKNERRNRHWNYILNSGAEAEAEDESGSGAEADGPGYLGEESSSSRIPPLSRTESLVKAHKTSETPMVTRPVTARPQSSDYVQDSDEENEELARVSRRFNISALPPYTDARPTIKTYFKIYSPSKAGRMLSIYESAPDRFNFSQSWGWKSSSFILDDGAASPEGSKGSKDGKLRYMVVIGNV